MPHPRTVLQILCCQRNAQAAANADSRLLQATGPTGQHDDDDEQNRFLIIARYFHPHSTQIHNIYRGLNSRHFGFSYTFKIYLKTDERPRVEGTHTCVCSNYCLLTNNVKLSLFNWPLQIQVLWVITLWRLAVTDVSTDLSAFIFRAK